MGAYLIRKFLDNPTLINMSSLINYAKENNLSDDEIIILSRGLAKSGSILKISHEKICDIPSTGGPSSLSTLICPLILRILENKIIKLGVPGRPAGGIDVLAQIDGYNYNPSLIELRQWFDETGYVHLLAKDNFAPLDAKLFQFRKENNALSVVSLAISSILSKKIAVGLDYIGLDIRVSKFGNFGRNWDEARENARRFNRIANRLGIDSVCFLTNGEVPFQPYIGRGESILALFKIFENSLDNSLRKHFEDCYKMALAVSINKSDKLPSPILLKEVFNINVIKQGGILDSFYNVAENTNKNHTNKLYANNNGFLAIDLNIIRNIIINAQLEDNRKQFPDTCGIILKCLPNEYVKRGDLICSYRYLKNNPEEFEKKLETAFMYLDSPFKINNLEIIS